MDLVVLSADAKMEAALRVILNRHNSVGSRAITADLYAHPEHDPGIFGKAHLFLQPFVGTHRHALVALDREGSGQEHLSADDIQREIQSKLSASGWGQRSAVVVIDPELETWVWANSPHVASALGWRDVHSLHQWLRQHGWLSNASPKPSRPKEAMHAALEFVRKAKSAAVYQQVARQVGFATCADPAFRRMVEMLRGWFPAAPHH